MNCGCSDKNRIIIVRGNDTNFNGQNFVHFNITSNAWDLSTMKATIDLGGITKTFTDLSNGIDLSYTASETASMPFGDIDGVLKVYNQEEQIATIESLLPFKVISIVHGDAIAVTPAEFNIDVKQGGETVMNIDIEAGVTVAVVPEIEMLPVGSEATVTNDGTLNHLLLKFHIPESDSIESIEKTSTEGLIDTYTIIWASGKTSTFEIENGNGIESITKTSTSGLVDTYTILFTDGTSTTFNVANGNGISSIEKTSTEDLVDTYTIYYTNGSYTTFEVKNGADATINGVNTLTLNTTYGISLVQQGDTVTISGKEITDAVDRIDSLIPAQASESNQLADKAFVNSSIATNTGNFIGTFESIADRDAYSGTITNNDYCFVVNGLVTNNGNDWNSFADLDNYDKSLLTNYDYGWVVNGSNFDLYRFDIVNQEWELRAENIEKDDVSLNAAYNRYKATVAGGSVTWEYEYTLNNSSFTANQWAAINSGATQDNIAKITTNENAIGNLSTLTTTDKSSLVGATNELNTKKLDKVTNATSFAQAYTKNANGTQEMMNIVAGASSAYSIVARTGTGTIYTATPTNDEEATNKSYVDTAISSLDSNKIDKGYAVNDFATNCITEIPQDIKLELSNGTLTLKSGSVVTFPDGTQYSVGQDRTTTFTTNGQWIVVATNLGILAICNYPATSGANDPTSPTGRDLFFNTTELKCKRWNGNVWENRSLPIAIITVSNGAISSIDQVFNGFGYIGNHSYMLPGVSVLVANGYNSDGTLKTITHTNNSLLIRNNGGIALSGFMFFKDGTVFNADTPSHFFFQNETPTLTSSRYEYWWCPKDNRWRWHTNTQTEWFNADVVLVGELEKSSTTFTKFDIKPVSGLADEYITNALGYTPENSANKVTSLSGSSTDTQYPSAKCVYDTKTALESSISSNVSALDSKKIDKGYAVNDFATNCITEIPQDVKVELASDGTLTVKSGTKLYVPNGSDVDVYQTTADATRTITSAGTYVICFYRSTIPWAGTPSIVHIYLNRFTSGSTDSLAGTTYHAWYDTTNNVIKRYADNTSTPAGYCCYPICIVTATSQKIVSIDKVFNGAGYIGHHAFVLPGVKALISNGFNADGTLKNYNFATTSLTIVEMTNGDRNIVLNRYGQASNLRTAEADTLADLVAYVRTYVRPLNKYYSYNGSIYLQEFIRPLVDFSYNDTSVTQFDIRPVSGLADSYIDTALGYMPENSTNKVTSLSSASTDTQYPSAKCVYDIVGDIETLLNNINSGS